MNMVNGIRADAYVHAVDEYATWVGAPCARTRHGVYIVTLGRR